MKSVKMMIVMLLAVTLAPATALAAGPGKGSLSKSGVRVGPCYANSVDVRYRLDSLMGEPVVGGSWSWSGDSSCSLPSSTVIWLKVQSGSSYGYVRLDPVVPDANEGFGYNVSGSPNWNETVCGYSGARPQGCMNSGAAKNLWKSGRVTGFEIGW